MTSTTTKVRKARASMPPVNATPTGSAFDRDEPLPEDPAEIDEFAVRGDIIVSASQEISKLAECIQTIYLTNSQTAARGMLARIAELTEKINATTEPENGVPLAQLWRAVYCKAPPVGLAATTASWAKDSADAQPAAPNEPPEEGDAPVVPPNSLAPAAPEAEPRQISFTRTDLMALAHQELRVIVEVLGDRIQAIDEEFGDIAPLARGLLRRADQLIDAAGDCVEQLDWDEDELTAIIRDGKHPAELRRRCLQGRGEDAL